MVTKKLVPVSKQKVLSNGKMAELLTKKVQTTHGKKEKSNYKSKRV